ncbi:MAG: S1C family serine protease [Nitrospinota bacterium]
MNNPHRFEKGVRITNLIPLLIILFLVWVFLGKPQFNFFQKEPELRAVSPSPGDLGADEKATIDVFELASPSVVFITNKRLQRSLFSFQVQEIPQGSGSGFMWDTDGHIVTNFHVIYKASEIEVKLSDGTSYDAELVGSDPDHDLAVLKINASASKLRPVLLGNSDFLRVGQKVLAIGNPFGLDSTLTTGIVSALGRSIEAITGRTIHDVIQTDAAINPGNSGGPLLDSFGRLIGINTAIISPSGSNAGIGFAVPVSTVNYSVSQMIAYGRVERPGIGVTLLPDYLSARLQLEGVPIFRVLPGGAAEKAGLQGIEEVGGEIRLGDVIVAVDNKKVLKTNDLISILDRFKVGDEVRVKYIRRGVPNEIWVILRAMR